MGTTLTPAPRGLRFIIGYKITKAAIELLAGAALYASGAAGFAQKMAAAALLIRHHATEAWSIALAEQLLNASTAHNVFVVGVAIFGDGILSGIEGWALYRRFAWAGWLVVVTTASLLPFEIRALLRHPNAGHVAVLLVNLAIVAYLLRRHATPHPAPIE